MAPRIEPTIVVFENAPRWAPEMERRFHDDHHVVVRACRRIRDVSRLVPVDDPAVVLFDVPSEPAACLDLLPQLTTPVVAMVDDATADLEWSLRELGATSILHEFTPGHVLADVCRRCWRITPHPTNGTST